LCCVWRCLPSAQCALCHHSCSCELAAMEDLQVCSLYLNFFFFFFFFSLFTTDGVVLPCVGHSEKRRGVFWEKNTYESRWFCCLMSELSRSSLRTHHRRTQGTKNQSRERERERERERDLFAGRESAVYFWPREIFGLERELLWWVGNSLCIFGLSL
jgi:hypothetical protein